LISGTVSGHAYTYYTPEEAEAQGIEWMDNWREAKLGDEGKWVLSDTGMVVGPIERVYDMTETGWSNYNIVQIPTGTFYGQPSTVMTHEERESRWTFSGKSPRHGHKDPYRPLTPKERRFVRFVLRYTMQLVAGGQKIDSMTAAEQAYLAVSSRANPNSQSFRREARRFARRANVERAIDAALGDLLDSKGISEEYIIDQLKELAEKEKGSDHVKHAVLRDFARMRGLLSSGKDNGGPPGREIPFEGYSAAEIEAAQKENASRSLPPSETPAEAKAS
jgi:hypothetical protein